MKNLLICLVFILAGSSPVLSVYGQEKIPFDTSNIEIQKKIEGEASPVYPKLEKGGDPKKKKKTATKQKANKVVQKMCKRPIAKRGNMGNSGAMRNMYSAKISRLP